MFFFTGESENKNKAIGSDFGKVNVSQKNSLKNIFKQVFERLFSEHRATGLSFYDDFDG